MNAVRKMETVSTEIMEPLMDGSFREREVEKSAYQCTGCGLVWALKWHAETCGERDHKTQWFQRYATGPIVNGKPHSERFYPRTALRREPVE